MSASENKTSLITPLLRFAYINVFQPRMPPKPKPGDKARFSALGLILPMEKMPDADKEKLKAMLVAVQSCAISAFGADTYKTLVEEKKFGSPFRIDIKSKGHPEEFKWFIQPWSHTQPGIVSVFKGSDGRPQDIKDPTAIFSGGWGRLLVHPFAYDQSGNRGVSFGLDGLQWVREDERLNSRPGAKEMFEATEDAPEDMGVSQSARPPQQGDANELASLLGGA
jgi:Protein of unknown function (DUF2815)